MRRQQVPDRLLNGWYQIESGLRFHGRSPAFQGCRQVRSASPTPALNAVFAGPAMRQVVSCMFISDASVSRERLLSTNSCSTMPTSSSARACRWRAAMRGGPTELLSYGRRALLIRGIQHVTVELVDCVLLAPSVVADVPGIVRRRDGRRVRDVDRRQACCELSNGCGVFFSEQRPSIDHGHCHASKSVAAGVAVVQGGVVVAGEQHGLRIVEDVDAPARRFRQLVISAGR